MNKKENIIIASILAVALIAFISLCILIKMNNLPYIDVFWRGFAYDIRGEKGGFLYWLFRIITEFGYIYVMAAVIILLGVYTRLDNRFFILIAIIILSRVFNSSLKSIYDRVRPLEDMRWQVETSSSFPSGHSTNVAVIFSYLAFLFYKDDHKRWIRVSGMVFSIVIIPLVMLSRNILGVHYLTDVLAGASCGVFCGCIGMLLLNFFNEKNILTQPLIKKKSKEEVVEE